MKIFNAKSIMLIFATQVIFSQNVMATLIGPSGWQGDNIEGFVASGAFPGLETSVSTLDFSGMWIYTSIGRESRHTNDIDKSFVAGAGTLDTFLAFSTSNTRNWGVWDTVDFDRENLFFEDSDGPWNIGLDSYSEQNSNSFKLFRLTEDTTLNYLAGNAKLSLSVGDIIVGFNDNQNTSSGGDYDDIIIVMRATPVYAPESLILLGLGLVGIWIKRRKMI